jgi:hypothetical protein
VERSGLLVLVQRDSDDQIAYCLRPEGPTLRSAEAALAASRYTG